MINFDINNFDNIKNLLDIDGYCIVNNIIPPKDLYTIYTDIENLFTHSPQGRNNFEGFKTIRINNIISKTRTLDNILSNKLLAKIGTHLMNDDNYIISSLQAIKILPGETAQHPHRDEDMYPIKRPFLTGEIGFSVLIALDDFTKENGATQIYPNSHTWEGDVNSPLKYDKILHKHGKKYFTQSTQISKLFTKKYAIMPKGSAVIYRGNTIHCGGTNNSITPRRGIVMNFVAGWLQPQEKYLLSVDRTLVRKLNPVVQKLIGYNLYPPFTGHIDGLHPQTFLLSKI